MKVLLSLLVLITVSCTSTQPNLAQKPNSNFKLEKWAYPSYPVEAAIAGVTGYVVMLLDIEKNGEAKNIRVVRSEPKGIFDNAATSAVRKYLYKPKTNNLGDAVKTVNHKVRMDFQLEKN